MDRKKFVIIFSAVVVLGALVFVYAISRDTRLEAGKIKTDGSASAKALESTAVRDERTAAVSTAETVGTPSPEPSITAEPAQPAVIKSEEVEVQKNSAEFDLKAVLYETADKATFLKFEYYLDGSTVIKEFSDKELPEISDIFKKRETNGPKDDGWRIGQLLLNTRYSKVYFTIIGTSSSAFSDTRIYSISLKDGKVKRIGSFYGRVGSLLPNSSGRLLAFSYLNSPLDCNHVESELLDVLACESDEFMVHYSRNSDKTYIGGIPSALETLYCYELKSWKTDTMLLLKQTVQTAGEKSGNAAKTAEVLYSIPKNMLLNADGTAIQPVNTGTGKTAGGEGAGNKGNTAAVTPKASVGAGGAVNADSGSLKTLKSFYSYLASIDDYSKAMNLLDEGFYLEMDLLKQFGVNKVLKKDIDADSASMYSEMLKSAKLDMVVKINENKDTSEIYYYQTLSLNAESQIKQSLCMQLNKTASGWRILLIKEADSTKEPFTESSY